MAVRLYRTHSSDPFDGKTGVLPQFGPLNRASGGALLCPRLQGAPIAQMLGRRFGRE